MHAKLIQAEKIIPGVMQFRFKSEKPIRFEPGQFIAVTLPHQQVDNRGDMREFSISSSPNDEFLEITASYVERNGSSYKRALLALRPGDEVSLGEPMGDFVLPKDKTIPLVFVATGIGTTPYASIVKYLFDTDEKRYIKLINAVSSPSGFLFEELWSRYKLDFVPIVTKSKTKWHGATGRLTSKKVLELAHPVENKLVYLAGPQSVIEPMFNAMLENGIPRYQLLLDYFPGY